MPLPRRLPLRAHLAGLAGVTMLAASCGGGSNSKATATTTFITVPVSTTAPPLSQPQLQSVVVQAGDLPAGWKAGPATASSDQAADTAAFAQCVGGPNTLVDVVAVAYSQDFANGSSTITSAATSFKSPDDVQADSAELTNPKASDCFTQVIKARLTAALPKGTTVKSVTLKVTPGPGTGAPANVVATASGSIVLSAQGHQLALKDDIAFLAGPRVEAQIAFYSTGNGVPAQVRADVIQKVSTRLANGS